MDLLKIISKQESKEVDLVRKGIYHELTYIYTNENGELHLDQLKELVNIYGNIITVENAKKRKIDPKVVCAFIGMVSIFGILSYEKDGIVMSKGLDIAKRFLGF